MCNMYSPARSLFTISDSIAIEILNENTILTGVGNELHLHNNKQSQVLDVRLKNKVHGIVKGRGVNAGKVLIYGEMEFIILEWQNDFKLCYHRKLSDWISAGIFFENEPGYALLTAHSVLLKFEKDESNTSFSLTSRVTCEDKSTLYCGHLSGKTWSELVVFGGNAFGELLIWQPLKDDLALKAKCLQKATLLQRIAAHNGVIFSIDYDAKQQLLITTSDDRSVRFWNVFKKTDWLTAVIKPTASGFGHMARVFQGKIFENEKTCYALTVGEDSNICLWRCTGELLFKQRQQFGAVIWNLAYDKHNQILYTVGSTGNIRAFNLKFILTTKFNTHEHQLQNLPSLNELDVTEYAAKIKFLTKFLVVCITSKNRLMLYDLNDTVWKVVSPFGFKCTVLEVCDNQIAICGYKHAVFYEYVDLEVKEIFNAEILRSVIRSLHFLSTNEILMCDDVGNCVLLKLQNYNEHVVYKIDLPTCKERWLTAACMLNDKFLLLSNRLGNLLLYSFEPKNSIYELKHILKHTHGYLGATFLKLIKTSETNAHVESAGHDGTLKTLNIDFKTSTLKVLNRQNVPIAWIENSILFNTSQSYLGFNDNHFVVWSSEHDISLQLACGGGHRCWHFYGYKDHLQRFRIRLAFIKNKKIMLFDCAVYNEANVTVSLPLRNRWHTSACNVLEIIKNKIIENEIFIISAGDDNLIKLNTFNNAIMQKFIQRAEIHTHISNVRALKVISLNSTKCLIFSGGGRAQLCLTEVDLRNYSVCEICNYSIKLTDNLTETKKTHSFEAETRIMSIDVKQIENSYQFQIYIACSDGYLRTFLAIFEASNYSLLKLQLVKEVFYGKCLLQVRLVADCYILIAATDGIVTVFDLNLEKILIKISLHASGINALDVYFNKENKNLFLLTGGDDQAVVYTKICFKNHENVSVLATFNLPQLHTAQVTAAKFSKNGLTAYTSGVDQNLVKFDLETMKILSITHSCVADVKGLDICASKNVCLLYGCGLQIFDIAE